MLFLVAVGPKERDFLSFKSLCFQIWLLSPSPELVWTETWRFWQPWIRHFFTEIPPPGCFSSNETGKNTFYEYVFQQRERQMHSLLLVFEKTCCKPKHAYDSSNAMKDLFPRCTAKTKWPSKQTQSARWFKQNF